MTFAEKLRAARKEAGMSQEKLAEKLGVSRQAITKWETDGGIPDIENIKAISNLFGLSMDELFSNKITTQKKTEYLYESCVEYDIDEPKHYDMKFGGVNRLVLSGYEGEKLRIRLASNTLPTLQNDFKVKLDDGRRRIDVDLAHKNGVTEAAAKESVLVFVQLPAMYTKKAELEVNAESVKLACLDCEDIELSAKTHEIALENITGKVEIDCNLDLNLVCDGLKGQVMLNQISATSKIWIPEGVAFAAAAKGIKTSLSFDKAQATDAQNADMVIELNGMNSELAVCTLKKEG